MKEMAPLQSQDCLAQVEALSPGFPDALAGVPLSDGEKEVDL